ncbi:MAG: RNA methyltransferase, partial [Lysobacteraceae bacterium]
VAEGGAESVPVLRIDDADAAFGKLRGAGFAMGATVVRGGESIFDAELPSRLVLLFGAETEGLPDAISAASELRLRIPGSGAVESLNVSVAAALCMAEWAKAHANPIAR